MSSIISGSRLSIDRLALIEPSSPFLTKSTSSRPVPARFSEPSEPEFQSVTALRRTAVLDFLSITLKHNFRSDNLRNVLHDGSVPCRVIVALYPSFAASFQIRYTLNSRKKNLEVFLSAYNSICGQSSPDNVHLDDLDSTYALLVTDLDHLRSLEHRSTAVKLASSKPSQNNNNVRMHSKDYRCERTITNSLPTVVGNESNQAVSDNKKFFSDHLPERIQDNLSAALLQKRRSKTISNGVSAPMASNISKATHFGKSDHLAASTEPENDLQCSRSGTHLLQSQTSHARDSITIDSGATYIIGNVIGKGQFGTVHRAIDTASGRIVAIKRIDIQNRDSSEVQSLMHEVDLLKSLSSPSIVQYKGFIKDNRNMSIIVEYVENGSLLSTIRTFGCFNEKLCAAYTYKILQGLTYLHSQDVVHCDLKCANVLTTKAGHVKLSDFGVSLNVAGDSTLKGEVHGTPNWLAPEVITLRGTCKSSDIWSLGCTILEMIQGQPPYGGLVAMAAMYSIVEDPHPPLPSRISDELRCFLLACFQKEPRERPTAADLQLHPWISMHYATMTGAKVRNRRSLDSSMTQTESILKSGLSKEQIQIINGNGQSRNDVKPIRDRQMQRPASAIQLARYAPWDSHLPKPWAPGNEINVRHILIKSSFQRDISCSVCNLWTRKAVYCEKCHVVGHKRCLEYVVICPSYTKLDRTEEKFVHPVSQEELHPLVSPLGTEAAPDRRKPSHPKVSGVKGCLKFRRRSYPVKAASSSKQCVIM